MLRIGALVAILALSFQGGLCAQEDQTPEPEIVKEEPKNTVTFAKNWDAAVAEARLLNVPIVVHSHGFY